MAPSLTARAAWLTGAAADYATAGRLQLRGMLARADPAGFGSGVGRVCVMVPGVYESWFFLRPEIDALQEAGHPVHVLPELKHNRRPVLEGAQLLMALLDRLDLHDVLLVGHSKGGLIAKYAMTQLDPARRIRHLVAIATPFGGSRYANWAPNRTLREFRAGDPVTALLTAQVEANARITSIFPATDPIIPEGSRLPGAAANVEVPVAGHFRILQHPTVLATVVDTAATPPEPPAPPL